VWLQQLVHSQLAPYGENRFQLVGEDLKLNPKKALALSMAFHELTTNAAKYGALVSPVGCVEVSWRVLDSDDGQRLHLQWVEKGGQPVSEPDNQGFGTRLITRGLAHELDAEVELNFAVTGVQCIIDLPIDSEDRK
jgi:two-component sensor histidine kinase